MRRVARHVLACTLPFALLVAPGAAQDFEGTVTMSMNISNMGMTVDMNTTTKDGKVRNEVNMMGQQIVTVIDTNAGTGVTLMPMQQAYMRMDLTALQDAAAGDMDNAPEIEATGRTETIAGHECEHYNVTVDGTLMDMCVAKGLGFFSGNMGMNGPGMGGGGVSGANSDVWRELFEDGFFPLKMSLNQNGMDISMVVTNIEQTSVSDDVFDVEIPDGWTEMPNMMGRMGSGGLD